MTFTQGRFISSISGTKLLIYYIDLILVNRLSFLKKEDQYKF